MENSLVYLASTDTKVAGALRDALSAPVMQRLGTPGDDYAAVVAATLVVFMADWRSDAYATLERQLAEQCGKTIAVIRPGVELGYPDHEWVVEIDSQQVRFAQVSYDGTASDETSETPETDAAEAAQTLGAEAGGIPTHHAIADPPAPTIEAELPAELDVIRCDCGAPREAYHAASCPVSLERLRELVHADTTRSDVTSYLPTVYLSGPMSGYPGFNFAAFDAVAWDLRESYQIISPAEHDRQVLREKLHIAPEDVPGYAEGDVVKYAESIGMVHDLLAWDFAVIINDANGGIVMLPGWESSSGARSERLVAEAIGRPVWLAVKEATSSDDAQCERWFLRADPEQRRCHDELAAAFAPVVTGHLASGEIRIVNEATGAAKGQKLNRYDLIPAHPLSLVARHYGVGAKKYEDRNWERGYDWSLSFGALMRHAWEFWGGDTYDDETGSHHMAAVVFHALALIEFGSTHTELDDRPRPFS